MMLYILAGPDDFSRTQTMDEIKHRLGDPSILAMSTTVLEGQKITVDELKHACETVPFMSEKRLVTVTGLLARFDTAPKTEKTRSNNSAARDPAPFAACLNNIPDFTIAVLIEDELPAAAKKESLFKSIAAKADVRLYPPIKDARLRAWIQKRVADLGASISPPALETLYQLVGSNLWIMASEIEKLFLYAKGRRIEETDVRALVGYTQDVSVFTLIDAIVDFKVEQAGQTLQQLLDHGAAPAYLLYMLDRQFRMIVRAKDLKARGQPDGFIQSKLGIASDFALQRTLEQAGRYSSARLLQIYQSLLEADLAMKTGRYEADLALNLLIAELCRRGERKPVRTGDEYDRF
jgi:DNA polymerase III subunit delta